MALIVKSAILSFSKFGKNYLEAYSIGSFLTGKNYIQILMLPYLSLKYFSILLQEKEIFC